MAMIYNLRRWRPGFEPCLGHAGYRDRLDVNASLRCSPMFGDTNLRHQETLDCAHEQKAEAEIPFLSAQF